MHLSERLQTLIAAARQDDLRVVCELTDAEMFQAVIERHRRQTAHDSVGGVVKVGKLLGHDGAALLEHDQRILYNHRLGRLYIHARILDEASFLCIATEHHHRFGKFVAIRECENIVARN